MKKYFLIFIAIICLMVVSSVSALDDIDLEKDDLVTDKTDEIVQEEATDKEENDFNVGDEVINNSDDSENQDNNLKKIDITYQSHVQNIGWQKSVEIGEISGTENRSLRVEGIKIVINNDVYDGSVEYQSHVQDKGWMDWVSNGSLSGTVGESKRIEAIRIRLTGEISEYYDIYYRVHVQNIGWLGWAKNGEAAGSEGYGYRMEAYQIMLVEKNAEGPNSNEVSFKYPIIKYQSHVQNIGWQKSVEIGEISGTENRSLRVEGIKIIINNDVYDGSIEYQSHVQDKGWMDWVSNGNLSGTVGESKRIEAIRIRLTGEISEYYDIYYRVHVQNIGWLGWAKNGEAAGSEGYGYRMEAYQIMLVEKNAEGPNNNEVSFKYPIIKYQSYIQNVGWQRSVEANEISGTQNKSLRVEGIKIVISNNEYAGSVEYQSHVQDKGWMDWVCDGKLSGITGQNKRIEAIRIRLTGEISEHYDIYYRVHVQNIGWLGWAKNGEAAGSEGYGYRMEAYQIMLVKKNEQGPISSLEAFKMGWMNDGLNTYYTFPNGVKATGIQKIDGIRYVFESDGRLKYSNVKVYADISSHQGNIDFDALYNSGQIDGIILRIGYWTSEDSNFKNYISEIKRLGIPYTVYLYSYAHNSNEALQEAQNMLSLYTKYQLNPAMNVYYDVEGYSTSLENSDDITQDGYQGIVESFIGYLGSNGIDSKLYSYYWFSLNRFNAKTREYLDWIAQYSEKNDYPYSWRGWQYTDAGTVPGISTGVDLSIFLY